MKSIMVALLGVLFMLGGARGAAAHHTAAAPSDSVKPPSAKTPAATIAGRWRGTSLCVDLKLAPGCHDEQVLYTFTPAANVSDSVTLQADKLVNGTYETMGTIGLRYDTAARQWRSEFRSPRGPRGLWSYVVHGDSLNGGLADLPSHAPVRVVRAQRAR